MATGCVTSLFDPTANARILLGPDGNVIPTPATKTGGVNEGIAKATGWATGTFNKADCWPFRSYAHEVIACDDSLIIPPAFNADIDLGETDFSFAFPEAKSGFKMDSFNGGRFHHSGRLIYSGGGTTGAYIAPANPDPVLGQRIIQNAEIQFGYLLINGVNVGQGVNYDCSAGTIMNNKNLDWLGINGWDGVANRMYLGIYISPPANQDNGFNENNIRIGQLQGFAQVGIDIPDNDWIGDNEWDVMINSTALPGSPCGAMVQTGTVHDEWRLSMTIYTGGCNVGLILTSHSKNNSYEIRQCTANLANVQDFGTGNRAI